MESTPANERIELLAEKDQGVAAPACCRGCQARSKGVNAVPARVGEASTNMECQNYGDGSGRDTLPCEAQFYIFGDKRVYVPARGTLPPSDGCIFFCIFTVGSVAEWVAEWREPMKEKNDIASWGLQTAKDLIKANGVMKPDYRRWVESFEVSFDTILNSKKYSSPFIIAELFNIYERRIKASAPVEQEWRLLYEMVGIVVSFKKLAVLTENAGLRRTRLGVPISLCFII